AVEGMELLQKLYNLLEAKDFKTRMEGVALLLDLCKTSPQLISTNIVQVCRVSSLFLSFSCFPKPVAVKLIQGQFMDDITWSQKAGKVLIKIPGCHGPHFQGNSHGLKIALCHSGKTCVSLVDKVALMKEFSHRRSELNGQALLDVAEHLSVLVGWVYPTSPEVVQRYALPVLWSFLGNKALPVRSANICTVVSKLDCALYTAMGTKLQKHQAASQHPHVQQNLSNIL
ncbi:TGRM2 protein, partial [Rhipidura dahli]|nr:TGRM2 protein [Rhipidura dahli]